MKEKINEVLINLKCEIGSGSFLPFAVKITDLIFESRLM